MVLSPFGRCSSNAITIQLAVKKRNTNVSKELFFSPSGMVDDRSSWIWLPKVTLESDQDKFDPLKSK